MSKPIIQLNEESVKSELKELVRIGNTKDLYTLNTMIYPKVQVFVIYTIKPQHFG